MLKKFSSFTLFLGILSSITCQGVNGAGANFKDRNNQVIEQRVQKKEKEVETVDRAENKGEDKLKKVNFLKQDVKAEVAPADRVEQGADLNAGEMQPAVNGEELVLSYIDENCDVFLNWLSKKCGFHENWYYLFHTYEGDKLALLKKIVCFNFLSAKFLLRYITPLILGVILLFSFSAFVQMGPVGIFCALTFPALACGSVAVSCYFPITASIVGLVQQLLVRVRQASVKKRVNGKVLIEQLKQQFVENLSYGEGLNNK
jgi:hypothetical protein